MTNTPAGELMVTCRPFRCPGCGRQVEAGEMSAWLPYRGMPDCSGRVCERCATTKSEIALKKQPATEITEGAEKTESGV